MASFLGVKHGGVLGMSRREFEDMLPRYGFSILVDNEANVQTELDT
jgi:hypothetical protein